MKKVLFILMMGCCFSFSCFSQDSDKIKTALLIIDIQDFYFPGKGPGLVNAEQAGLNAGEILKIFRDKNQLVIHVRHKSSHDMEIRKDVTPIPGEKVITKEDVNSFLKTDLLEYLQKNRVTRLILIGMQTHLCLEAATRAAYDYGFECIVVGDACATKDLKYGDKTVKAEDVQTCTLATIDNIYGKVIDLKAFREDPDKYLFGKFK